MHTIAQYLHLYLNKAECRNNRLAKQYYQGRMKRRGHATACEQIHGRWNLLEKEIDF